VNGTNVFLYPEGRGFDFTSRVVVRTEPEWRVATGMRSAGTPRTYRAECYHEVVDMPLFIGRFDLDSAEIDGRWYRLATYPEGALHGEARSTMWDHIRRMVPPQVAVFGETPWDSYTTLIVFEPSFPGGSALEHANSHLGIYATTFIGSPVLALITAHEMFHAWNVKRLRPSDLVPYDYSRPQPTPLLWVSEGITDYYADLAIVRGGIVPPSLFYQITGSKVSTVAEAPPVALEDASLSTWISPTDGTATIYYPKGSLAGMLLDILIRDATDNEASLDDVMRALYEATYRRGHGFTTDDWWRMVTRVAEGRRFDDFYSRYVDGRESFPWAEVLPLAGLELDADSTPTPRLGVFIASDSAGVRVTDLAAGGAAADAGVRKGDYLLRVGDVEVRDADFGSTFRARYGTAAEGTPLEIVVRRNGATERIASELRFIHTVSYAIREQRDASPKARRIRAGILGSASPPGGH
jgi:predicted metalloprotease with PDZ domain